MSVGPLDRPSAMFSASKPAQRARGMLGECLGALQDIRDPQVNVDQLNGMVAKAIGALFAVQSSEPADPAHISGVHQAMDYLRAAMVVLQDLSTSEPAVHRATEVVARVLAFLYPLARAQERASMMPPPPVGGSTRSVPHDMRRATHRVPLDCDIGFQSDTNFYMGFSEDISEGGLFLSTYDYLPLGSAVNVNFTLPDGYVVGAPAVVRWVREYNPATPDVVPGMGVQFLELTGEDRGAIQRFLRRRAPLFYEHA